MFFLIPVPPTPLSKDEILHFLQNSIENPQSVRFAFGGYKPTLRPFMIGILLCLVMLGLMITVMIKMPYTFVNGVGISQIVMAALGFGAVLPILISVHKMFPFFIFTITDTGLHLFSDKEVFIPFNEIDHIQIKNRRINSKESNFLVKCKNGKRYKLRAYRKYEEDSAVLEDAAVNFLRQKVRVV